MVTGTLRAAPDTGIYITDDNKPQNISIKPGQFLYLSVRDCWIPVVIEYSPYVGNWVFQNLESVKVNGQKVMLKN
ncbi:hypothetical protein H6A65_05535 [Mediterraneibacter glycyrrhizinilyticus]|uniref:hypothetical protein n=1 Tax=Mediterraneibacter glycyrrhizinilyticus TaxID=342942 RepID=UPI0019618D0C|nr:hypothetical protein [Mediterraneibacter glycyrrhizinilyticus]MBM6750958.1 hypothetical protein [Mediterraneibacter glycyrrhizinilyticus]